MPKRPDDINSLPSPDAEAALHSARLSERIRAEIEAAGGAVPFLRFMELALYTPGLGYYSAGTRKFGAGGDFVTAPEVSALFSRCVARQCSEVLAQVGGDILELGAGSGAMAAEVLRELETLKRLPQRYWILELSGELRQRQRATLAARAPHLFERVEWLDGLPEFGFRGIILGNEVLDALPVQRFRISEKGPVVLSVGWDGKSFVWRETDADRALTDFLNTLQEQRGYGLPSGYESEFNPRLEAWLASLAERLAAGALLFIDYGYPRAEYYHPQRTRGTLLCHYRHRAHDDPLILPGLQDIATNVDFSALAEAAVSAGLAVSGYTSQAYFLFGCGLEAMLAEIDPEDSVRYLELARQAKILTLPGQMGERFKAMALTRGIQGQPRGFALFDERGRL